MIWAGFAAITLLALFALLWPLLHAAAAEKRPARFAVGIVAVALPAGAWLLYLGLGSPNLPDQPFAQRMQDPDFALQAEGAALQQRLDRDPDAAGFVRLGEILVELAGGRVTPEAGQAFARALQIDPNRPEARFFAGLAMAQRGDREQALAVWRALKKDSAENAPWLPILRKSIAGLENAERP